MDWFLYFYPTIRYHRCEKLPYLVFMKIVFFFLLFIFLQINNLVGDFASFLSVGKQLANEHHKGNEVSLHKGYAKIINDPIGYPVQTSSGSAKGRFRFFTNKTISTTSGKKPAAAILTRGPYLNSALQDGIVIRWRTDIATDSRVAYGSSVNALLQLKTDNTLTTEHIITITGLSANAIYYYRIGSAAQTLQGDAENFFKTMPVAGSTQKMRFLAMGDMGNNSVTQKKIRDAWISFNGGASTDGWLLLGDNAYNDGTDAEYQTNFFNVYQGSLSKNHVLWPSPGNHDYANRADRQADHQVPYYDIFTLPSMGQAGGVASNTESYYSYNYANVHFVALDSYGWESGNTRLYDTLGPQAVWLKQDLSANTQKWTIVYFHHPPYTKGSHDSDTEGELVAMRRQLVPILERNKVDLVLNGHSHSYERSYLLNGHYGLENTFDTAIHTIRHSGSMDDNILNTSTYIKSSTESRNGIVYAVVGSSGQPSSSTSGFPHNAMAYSNVSNGGALYFEVECNRLQAKWICDDGVVRDNFTILKDVNKTTEVVAAAGSPIILQASWTGNYIWNNSSTTKSIQVTPTTNSIYSVTDNEACLTDLFNVDVMHTWVKLCPPVVGTTLSAINPGASYQWQEDTGTGFTNIIDNLHYTGTTSASLQLINIPTSWYGHKFRCKVDGNAGKVYQLQFIASFIGNAGTAWENPANWSCGAVPDDNTDVVINIGNAVVNTNVACRNIQLNPVATLTVKSGNSLTVTH